MIHYGSVESSRRLQRVVTYLTHRGHRGATTREIMQQAGVVAVNTAVAEIRANGIGISCTYERTLDDGSRVYRYVLESHVGGAMAAQRLRGGRR